MQDFDIILLKNFHYQALGAPTFEMVPFTPGARPTHFYKKFPPSLVAVAGIRHFVNRNL